MKTVKKRAPKHLRPNSRRWWLKQANELFVMEMDTHHEKMLTMAAQCLDVIEVSEEAVRTEGPFKQNRHGEWKQHPGVNMARDARGMFLRLVKALDLDEEGHYHTPGKPVSEPILPVIRRSK
jgi:phage terminase small subunit